MAAEITGKQATMVQLQAMHSRQIIFSSTQQARASTAAV